VGNMPTNVSVTVTVEGKNIVMTKEGREECEVYMPGVGEDATDALLSFKRALSKGGGGVEEVRRMKRRRNVRNGSDDI